MPGETENQFSLTRAALSTRARANSKFLSLIGQSRLVVVLALSWCWAFSSHASGLLYHVVDLGTLGGTNSEAEGISPGGLVTGDSLLAGNTNSHAFLYDGGGLTDGSSLGDGFVYYGGGMHRVNGYYCDAVTVDDSNRVVGPAPFP